MSHNHQVAVERLTGDILVNSGAGDFTENFIQCYQQQDKEDKFPDGFIQGNQVNLRDDYKFNIECAGCCWQFLSEEREYTSVVMDLRMVKFGTVGTSCYVDGPQGDRGKHGVVKTGHDLNLGETGARCVQGSVSYQLYGDENLSGLAVGTQLKCRIEAIAVNVLGIQKSTAERKLQGCYFNYANAAILELYRYCNNQESLKGQCCWTGLNKPKTEASKDDKAKSDADVKKIEEGVAKLDVK